MNFNSRVQFTDRCGPVKVAELGSAGAVGRTNRLLSYEFKSIFAYCGASMSYVTALLITVIIIIIIIGIIRFRKPKLSALGICYADHATSSIH
jgi:ABC-type sugar transport system permease subunit